MPGDTISVASWNVEHFNVKPNDLPSQVRLDRVVSLIQAEDAGSGQGGPDVFAILEATGKQVFEVLTKPDAGLQLPCDRGAADSGDLPGSAP